MLHSTQKTFIEKIHPFPKISENTLEVTKNYGGKTLLVLLNKRSISNFLFDVCYLKLSNSISTKKTRWKFSKLPTEIMANFRKLALFFKFQFSVLQIQRMRNFP